MIEYASNEKKYRHMFTKEWNEKEAANSYDTEFHNRDLPVWQKMKKIRDAREQRMKKIMYERLYKKFNDNQIAQEFIGVFETFCKGYKKPYRDNYYKHKAANFKSLKRVKKELEVLFRKSRLNQTHSKIAAACGLKVHDITMLLKKFRTGAWHTET